MKKHDPQVDPQDDKEHRSVTLSLAFSLFVCAALAVFCFWLNLLLERQGLHTPAEISLHVGIAFIVAGTVIGLIEFKAHKIAVRETSLFRKQVSMDVFKALFGRIVPEEVFHEIDFILHHNIVRSNCKYVITFRPPYEGMPEDSFVIRREVTYTVTNLLNQRHVFLARSAHTEDIDLNSKAWRGRNYHLQIFIDGKPKELVEGANLKVKENFAAIEHEVLLEPRESKEIGFHGEEPAMLSAGRISYLQATPVIGIEVMILNSYPERIREVRDTDVQMNHPGAGQMRINSLGRFTLDRAFLPGQGFQVTWKEKKGGMQEREETSSEEPRPDVPGEAS